MKKLPVAALLCVISSTLSAQNLRIVNAASLSEVSVSPGTIITIFGTRFATAVAAAPDAKTPPTSLGGVTVTIGGTPAALFYVSQTQINAVVGATTPLGAETVTITSGSLSQTGTVTVSATAPPGLFSLSGSGTRDGAILNAITFLLGDFSTHTGDFQTYLALFATGLTSTTPTVTIGGIPVTVSFAGPAPCCMGLEQINVVLPDSLAGAGRVPVVLTANGQTSNTVEVVLLPPSAAKQFSGDQDNQKRNRELAALAYVPNTSLVLSTDQNDDVVRVIDVKQKTVTHVIALPEGAGPIGVAVNAAGTLAAVAESGLGKVAIIDLATFIVKSQVATGAGASSVAISGSQAIVVNRDVDSITVVDMTAGTALKTLAVGRGPVAVAVDASAAKAYTTNENDGTISVIDLAGLSVAAKPISLGASARPQAIALLTGGAFALVTAPGNGPDGAVFVVKLSDGTSTTLQANPGRSGGSSDVAYFNGKAYFANQAGGSISVLPINATNGVAGAVTTIKVDLGARALAIDAQDNLLVVSNEGTGTLVLVDLSSNAVIGRIDAVRTGEGDDNDDHSDRGRATNLPTILTLTPASAKAGATFTLTITGTNLTGATEVTFGGDQGNGNGSGKGNDRSSDFTVKNIVVSAGGTTLTASVSIDASAKPGARIVQVKAANGESTMQGVGAAVFMVLP